jgi:hypothetical protein
MRKTGANAQQLEKNLCFLKFSLFSRKLGKMGGICAKMELIGRITIKIREISPKYTKFRILAKMLKGIFVLAPCAVHFHAK